eukprot:412123-Rhodomonas_salina.2
MSSSVKASAESTPNPARIAFADAVACSSAASCSPNCVYAVAILFRRSDTAIRPNRSPARTSALLKKNSACRHP